MKTEGIVAVVPARAGSKRLPRKNVRILAGKPMIAYTIEAALGCRLLDGVYVSSEDADVLGIAADQGAGVIERPGRLAEDHVHNTEVVRHALETLAAQGRRFDHVVLLQPTSPLRTAQHLEACLTAYLGSEARSTLSVCAAEYHPASLVVVHDGFASPYESGANLERRRDSLPAVYRPNGAIHALHTAAFQAEERWVVAPCLAYMMNHEDSVDVDEEIDFARAEAILRRRGKERVS